MDYNWDINSQEEYKIKRRAWKNTLEQLEKLQERQIDCFISKVISDSKKDRKELKNKLEEVKNILQTLKTNDKDSK